MKKVHVRVCVGTNCAFHGGQSISDKLDSESLFDGKVEVETVKCFEKLCADGKNSPIVEIDGKVYKKISIEKISEIVFSKLTKGVK